MRADLNRIIHSKEGLMQDFMASLVVFLVALPLCMGIAIASGVPPVYGLISGIVGGLIVGFFTGSPLQVSGPAAGLTVIVWEIVQQYGLGMLGFMVCMAGVLQWVAGQFKLGQAFRAVSPTVIHGMLSGIGVLILASQFHVMLDAKPMGSGLDNLLGIPQRLWGLISGSRDKSASSGSYYWGFYDCRDYALADICPQETDSGPFGCRDSGNCDRQYAAIARSIH